MRPDLMDFCYWWANTIRDWFTPSLSADLIDVNAFATEAPTKPYLPQSSAARLPGRGKRVRLHLCEGQFIIRQISALRLPRSMAEKAVHLDLAEATPFKTQDVAFYMLHSVPGTAYAIVKKSLLQSTMQEFHIVQRQIVELAFKSKDGTYHARSREDRGSAKPVFGLSAIVAFLFFATIGHVSWRQHQAIQLLESQIADKQPALKDMRAKLERQTRETKTMLALRQQLKHSAPVVAIWEELSNRLPDNTFLADLTITGTSAAISGFSLDASLVPTELSGSHILKEVELTGSVTRVPGEELQRFQAEMVLSR